MAIPRARIQVQKRAGCLGNSKECRFVVDKELDFRLKSIQDKILNKLGDTEVFTTNPELADGRLGKWA